MAKATSPIQAQDTVIIARDLRELLVMFFIGIWVKGLNNFAGNDQFTVFGQVHHSAPGAVAKAGPVFVE